MLTKFGSIATLSIGNNLKKKKTVDFPPFMVHI